MTSDHTATRVAPASGEGVPRTERRALVQVLFTAAWFGVESAKTGAHQGCTGRVRGAARLTSSKIAPWSFTATMRACPEGCSTT